MKKILIITLEFPPQVGGIATAVAGLVQVLGEKNILVLAPDYPQAQSFDSTQPYRIVRKNFFFPWPVWPRWLLLFWHACSILRQERVELIFIHHLLPVGYIARLVKIFYHIPFLVFVYGADAYMSTRSAWKRLMTAGVIRQAELIVFSSHFLQQRLQSSLPEIQMKSRVVYPCPEAIFFARPASDNLAERRDLYGLAGKTIILCVSRLIPGKGVSHLIAVLPELIRRVPDLILVIVGNGPKLPDLQSQAQALSVHQAIRFVGDFPHSELPQWYGLADLFVLLSHTNDGREEGLGLVLLEAAAMGLPIVAGKSGGVEEAVINNETGLLVNTENRQEVLEAIVRLLKNKEEAEQFGALAYERVRKVFVWPEQLKQLEPWIN